MLFLGSCVELKMILKIKAVRHDFAVDVGNYDDFL